MYLNKAIIIGNLTRDPEQRSLPSGVGVTNFSVATNRVWKDKSGAKQEDTQFHNVVVFGVQAEHSAQYLKKGSSVLVEGRMQTRSWDAGDGSKKYRTEIVADRVQFGPRSSGGGPYDKKDEADQSQPKNETEGIDYPPDEINPDDIPF
ncbi:MAG: single-stranded DNA-binding protein [Candidatus Paceibacterota bacterium]